MAKQAYYFSHDSNAKDDPKIIKLRIKHGWKGYGLFWALIEMLRDQDSFKMQTDYDSIAFALREDFETIKSVINDFDLFIIEYDEFYSESLLKRMKLKEEQSDKAREAANKRWNKKSNADAMQTHSERNANPMQLKESKVKEIKVNKDSHNEIFRTLWKSNQWIESVCMMFKSSKKETLDHLDKFRIECITKDEFKETEKDAKSHFVNWIKKGNPIESKQTIVVLEARRTNRNPE
jgi:hypothetical protein